MIYCCFLSHISLRRSRRRCRFSIFQIHETHWTNAVHTFVCIIENAIKLFYYFILLLHYITFHSNLYSSVQKTVQYALSCDSFAYWKSSQWNDTVKLNRPFGLRWIWVRFRMVTVGHAVLVKPQTATTTDDNNTNTNTNSNNNGKQLIILIHIRLMEEIHNNKSIIFNFIRIVIYRSVRLCCQWRRRRRRRRWQLVHIIFGLSR